MTVMAREVLRGTLFGDGDRRFASISGEFTYLYNVPDLWQGGYKNSDSQDKPNKKLEENTR